MRGTNRQVLAAIENTDSETREVWSGCGEGLLAVVIDERIPDKAGICLREIDVQLPCCLSDSISLQRRSHEVLTGNVPVRRREQGGEFHPYGVQPRGGDPISTKRLAREWIPNDNTALTEVTIALEQARNIRGSRLCLLRSSEVTVEKKEIVRAGKRTSQCSAELVPTQVRCTFVRKIEEVFCIQTGVPEEFVCRTMKVAATRPRSDRNLGAAITAVFGIVVVFKNREFLDRIDARIDDEIIQEEVVIVDAIEQEVIGGLGCATDIDGAAGLIGKVRAWCRRSHAWGQKHQLKKLPAIQRHGFHKPIVEYFSDCTVDGLKRVHVRDYFNMVFKRTGNEEDIDFGLSAKFDLNTLKNFRLKPSPHCRQCIAAVG